MAVTYQQLGKFGRIGNQLFQIASTIGIARRNNMNHVFPEWEYSKYFKRQLPIGHLATFNISKEKKFEYIGVSLSQENNYNLFGYYQSERYWNNCKDEVLSYFQFTDELLRKQSQKMITVDAVAIHVRRGDYLELQDYHPVLTLDYYNRAIQQFDKEQRFIIFSDDIEWCKKYFLTDRFSFANGTQIEDLCLMSLCSGHIIANSSFSWWGQYLSHRHKTVAPSKDKWFGLKASHNVDDLYQDHWMLV